MLIVYKRCKECGEKFTPKSPQHNYHERKCFMMAYRRKQKEFSFPQWTCPECKKTIQLDFNPLKDNIKWITFECPICKYSRLVETLGID